MGDFAPQGQTCCSHCATRCIRTDCIRFRSPGFFWICQSDPSMKGLRWRTSEGSVNRNGGPSPSGGSASPLSACWPERQPHCHFHPCPTTRPIEKETPP